MGGDTGNRKISGLKVKPWALMRLISLTSVKTVFHFWFLKLMFLRAKAHLDFFSQLYYKMVFFGRSDFYPHWWEVYMLSCSSPIWRGWKGTDFSFFLYLSPLGGCFLNFSDNCHNPSYSLNFYRPVTIICTWTFCELMTFTVIGCKCNRNSD